MAEASHEHGAHSGHRTGAWTEEHLGGLIMPLGKRIEGVLESMLVLIVNGFFTRIATLCLIIMTPVLVLEFLLRSL